MRTPRALPKPPAPKRKRPARPALILTIGHSTRPLDEFIAMLKGHAVEQLADVRTIPRSRHNPQFNRDSLPAALRRVHIGYVHLPGLGGLRKPRPDSPNTAWRNASFRGYADYMLTPAFEDGLAELRTLAQDGPVAVMCAEAVPWRCHRSLLADALFARGVVVQHIMGHGVLRPHQLTPFADFHRGRRGRRVTYPAAPAPGPSAPGPAAG